MSTIRDLIGRRFGRLLVTDGPLITTNPSCYAWGCLCDCGQIAVIRGPNLVHKNTISCGCRRAEILGPKAIVYDLTDKRFGRLLVVARAASINKQTAWKCRCKCGNTAVVRSAYLRSGKTTSCGCFQRESASLRQSTHRSSKTPEYRAWQALKKRCYCQTDKGYQNWGGRGIRVCKRWRISFENFLSDMGRRPSSKHSVDRIDNSKNYSKKNCRWATVKMQQRNKRNNIRITYRGTTAIIIEWAEALNIPAWRIYARYKRGLRPPKLFTP